jgi:hypothetical protein
MKRDTERDRFLDKLEFGILGFFAGMFAGYVASIIWIMEGIPQ